jgi:hypothetical protein
MVFLNALKYYEKNVESKEAPLRVGAPGNLYLSPRYHDNPS